jgi:hypothetical protein
VKENWAKQEKKMLRKLKGEPDDQISLARYLGEDSVTCCHSTGMCWDLKWSMNHQAL